MLAGFLSDDRGVTAIEYALIGSLVLVAAIPAMTHAGGAVESNLYDIIGAIASWI